MLNRSPLVAGATHQIARSRRPTSKRRTRFTLRLIVHPGYGQRGSDGRARPPPLQLHRGPCRSSPPARPRREVADEKEIATASRANRKTWLITALLAAVAVAYVVFIFLPCQRSIDVLQAQVQERSQQILQAQSLARTVAQARVRLAATREVSQQWRADAPRAGRADHALCQPDPASRAAGVAHRPARSAAGRRAQPRRPAERHPAVPRPVCRRSLTCCGAWKRCPERIWVRDLRLHAKNETRQHSAG